MLNIVPRDLCKIVLIPLDVTDAGVPVAPPSGVLNDELGKQNTGAEPDRVLELLQHPCDSPIDAAAQKEHASEFAQPPQQHSPPKVPFCLLSSCACSLL